MNSIPDDILKKANEEAVYNLYLYLSDKTTPLENEALKSIVHNLEDASKKEPNNWKSKDLLRLNILKNAVGRSSTLANSKIGNITRSKSGLTACTFTRTNGSISFVFKGTGSGEWIDNGEGLSGIAEENTYIIYEKGGGIAYRKIVQKDYATDQQVEALNWFCGIVAANNFDADTDITVSGHSKGGNKAQFIAICSDLVDMCCSFSSQGFSPEALSHFKREYGEKYNEKRASIYSFSADNDYVNVLGERLVPDNHIYYLKSRFGLHAPEAILDETGSLRPQCAQGRLSMYVETVSKELMKIKPSLRQYATLGVMNIFQKYLGEGVPVNNDNVSIEKTIAGVSIAVASVLRQISKLKK